MDSLHRTIGDILIHLIVVSMIGHVGRKEPKDVRDRIFYRRKIRWIERVEVDSTSRFVLSLSFDL